MGVPARRPTTIVVCAALFIQTLPELGCTGDPYGENGGGAGATSGGAGTGQPGQPGFGGSGQLGASGSSAGAPLPGVPGAAPSGAGSGGGLNPGNAGASAGGNGVGASGTTGAQAGESAPPGAYGGYISSGSWQGFAWTATSANGGSIMPMNFAESFDFPLCASGNVNAGTSNVAMLGWNVNQTTVEGAPAEPATPTLDGISIAISNRAGSELRLQIQGANGATDENDRWCAVIPGTGGFIPFAAFNTECWAGGNGMAYAGQPIVAVMVLVPGLAGGMVSFDFCVDELAETDENGTPAGTGCSLSGSPGEGGGSISGSDTRVVTREGRQYVVQNNVWNGNGGAQTLSVNGTSFSVTQQGNSSGTGGPPTSFPSVFIGSNFGRSTSGSGLPKQVSALSSVQTGWRWSGGGGIHNAAYDVWFSTGAGGDGGNPSGGYLMVWFQRDDSIVPLGSPAGTTSIGGKPWQYWTCGSGCQNGVGVISYVPTSGSLDEWSFDLKDFIEHAVSVGSVRNEWYLTNVFAGFEIWSGGQGLTSESFCAVVQ